MRKLRLIAALLFTVFLMSGCTVLSFDSNDIMCPPKATGSKVKIQELIDNEAGTEYVLKYPKYGTNKSSIIIYDIDKDGSEEAIAFYYTLSDNSIHILFVKETDDNFKVVDNIVCEGNYIDRVDFLDIDGDSVCEILIGYSIATVSQNYISIYRFSDTVTKLNTSSSYSTLVTGDFNHDNNDDILLMSLYSGDNSAQAKLMVYDNNGGLSELGQTELDSDVTKYAYTQYGQLSFDIYGAVIDGVNSTGEYTTQIIYYDASLAKLVNPLYVYSGYAKTRRSTQVCSLDIDSDGIIEFPVCSEMHYTQNEDLDYVARQVQWNEYKFDQMTSFVKETVIICSNDGYMFSIPDKWENSVTARYDINNREMTVYEWEYVDGEPKMTNKLLTIKAYNKLDYDESKTAYAQITSTSTSVYTYSIPIENNYMSITDDEVLSSFSLI